MRSDIPDIEEPAALADWVEVNLFCGGKGVVTRTELRRILAASTEHEADDIEVAINFLIGEIENRQIVTPSGYPFLVNGLKILLDPKTNQEFYKFLLLMEFKKNELTTASRGAASDIFDEISIEALKNYFGEGTNVLRFAWPPAGERPADFEAALEWLSTHVGLPRGAGQNSPALKDGGVDIVAWKAFPDDRTGFLFALAQCTVQRDWFPKATDIRGGVWLHRINSGREAMTILMLPFMIPKDFPRWDELRTILNIVFERFRLAYHLSRADSAAFPAMTSWSQQEMLVL